MKTAYVKTQILRFIGEFEDSVDRCITLQEFIDQIPEYYKKLAVDSEKPLHNITYWQFIQASQVGYKLASQNKQRQDLFERMNGRR